MAACPRCGNLAAYVGMQAVECPNEACANYVAPVGLTDDDSEPEHDGSIDWLNESDDELAIDDNDIP